MNKLRIALLTSLVMNFGCMSSDHSWTTWPVNSNNSPWDRVIERFEYSYIDLSNAVTRIQRLANESGKPHITLHMAKVKDPMGCFYQEYTSLQPFKLERVTVKDLLTYVANMANYQPYYRGNEAVLAPHLIKYTEVPIKIDGRCFSKKTGEAVGRLSFVCTIHSLNIFDYKTYTMIHEVKTKENGAYSLHLIVPGYADIAGPPDFIVSAHLKKQNVSMIVIADDYYPKRLVIELAESNLQYKVDIEMEK